MATDAAVRVVGNMLEAFQAEHAGKPVDVVRPALADAWAGMNEGAHLGEPALSQCAEAVSEGRRVWIDERAHIMVEGE